MPGEIKVSGLKELNDNLRNLGSVTGTKAMRGGMFAATKPLIQRSKQNASIFSQSGALEHALRRVFKIETRTGASGEASRFTISIGAKVRDRVAIALYNLFHKPKRPRRGIFHGHFLEFGTATGTRPWHFLEGALRSTQSICASLMASETAKRVKRALTTKRPVND